MLGWLLRSAFLLIFLSCVATQTESVKAVFFSPGKVEQLEAGERRSLSERAIADRSIDALALASQLDKYLNWWEKDPLHLARQQLAMAERLLQEGIYAPTFVLLQQVIEQKIDATLAGGSSLQQRAKVHLAGLSPSPFIKSALLADLVLNYPVDDKVRARWYYSLGENLEYIQRWDEAMDAYQHFALYPDVVIPQVSNAHSIVKSKLSIYHSNRNWVTSDSLNSLIAEIRSVIQKQLVRDISRYLANDFFAISGNFTNDSLRRGDIKLANFLSPRVHFGEFSPGSNNQEAWLETDNWPMAISRWYLYFRRIDYPANQEIDGKWEWAGVFIGDPL